MAADCKLDYKNIEKFYWREKFSLTKIANLYNVDPSTILKRMKKYGIPRRSLSESAYASYKNLPMFSIKDNLTKNEEFLKIAGIMLYVSEGTLKGKTVDFSNSNPYLVKLFLNFLRTICGVAEERIRLYLYIFSDQDVEAIIKFWSEVTNIPFSHFTKPYIRKTTKQLTRRMPYGLIKIRYSDKRLLVQLTEWASYYINKLSSNDGQVAEGTMAADCVNAASYRKIG